MCFIFLRLIVLLQIVHNTNLPVWLMVIHLVLWIQLFLTHQCTHFLQFLFLSQLGSISSKLSYHCYQHQHLKREYQDWAPNLGEYDENICDVKVVRIIRPLDFMYLLVVSSLRCEILQAFLFQLYSHLKLEWHGREQVLYEIKHYNEHL